jgi:hypothetical protein
MLAAFASRERDTLVATAAAVILALWLFTFRTIPIITADEIGYLGNAREIVWGNGPNMARTDTYSAGYSLLLLPFEWLLVEPRAVYRAAMVINALLVTTTVPVLVALARAFRFDSAPRLTPWFALVIAFWPTELFQAYLALPEVGLRLLTLAAVVAGLSVTRGRGWPAALTLAVLSAAAFAFHARMLPLVALSVAILALAVVRRRLDWRWALAAVAVLLAGCAAIEELNGWLQVELWGGRRGVGGSLTQLLTAALASPGPFMLRLFGHLWYQAAATALLVPVGVVVLLYWIVRDRTDLDRTIMAAAVLLLVAAIAGAGASKLIRPQSFDWLIYGRFLDIITPVPMLLGAIAMASQEWRRVLAPWMAWLGLAVISGGVALFMLYAARNPGGPNLIEVGGLTPFVLALRPFSHESGLVLLAPLVTVLAGLTFFLLAGRRFLIVPMALLYGAAMVAATHAFNVSVNTGAEATYVDVAAQYARRGDDPVLLDRTAGGGQLYIHQYMMGLHFDSIDVGNGGAEPGAIVVMGAGAAGEVGGDCLAQLMENNLLVRIGEGNLGSCPPDAPAF